MNRSVQYIFCDGYFGGIHFYLFLNNKILNPQPIEADGYKKLLITMSAKKIAAKIYYELIAKFDIL